jgi:microcystin-dependent protein
MTQPFLGQIQPFGFNFAPKGWALCNGQILSVSQNAALFSLIGTFYGGNGTTTFALPNLESRVPINMGTSPAGDSYPIGESAGEEMVSVLIPQLPAHAHAFVGSSADATAGQTEPVAGVALAKAFRASGTVPFFYGPMTTPQPLNTAAVANYGQSQPHSNVQPYLAINWCIALSGIFPSRN